MVKWHPLGSGIGPDKKGAEGRKGVEVMERSIFLNGTTAFVALVNGDAVRESIETAYPLPHKFWHKVRILALPNSFSYGLALPRGLLSPLPLGIAKRIRLELFF